MKESMIILYYESLHGIVFGKLGGERQAWGGRRAVVGKGEESTTLGKDKDLMSL